MSERHETSRKRIRAFVDRKKCAMFKEQFTA